MGPVRRREVAGEERWVWWCRGRGEGSGRGNLLGFPKADPIFKSKPTVQINRWIDQRLRSDHDYINDQIFTDLNILNFQTSED
jgi:hypothetical protein